MNNTATVQTQDVKDEATGMIIEYFANMRTSDSIAEFLKKDENEVSDILSLAQREWDEVEVDAEGPTVEQDKELDYVLDRVLIQLDLS
jgi:hypothetical protein